MKIALELYDSINGTYREVHLPMADAARLKTFGNPCFDKHIYISSYKGNFPYTLDCLENIMLLNNLLLKIDTLPSNQKERVKEFYALSNDKNYFTLQTAYNSRLSFESFAYKEPGLSQEEVQIKVGQFYLLQLVPDIIISLDGLGELSSEDAILGFHTGVRSGAIKFNNGKYYVIDRHLIGQCTNEDLDFIEQIETYEGGMM